MPGSPSINPSYRATVEDFIADVEMGTHDASGSEISLSQPVSPALRGIKRRRQSQASNSSEGGRRIRADLVEQMEKLSASLRSPRSPRGDVSQADTAKPEVDDLPTAKDFRAMVSEQSTTIEDPDNKGQLVRIPVMQTTRTDAELMAAKAAIERLGNLGMRCLLDSGYTLLQKAEIFESMLSLKLDSELCALRYSEKFSDLGLYVEPFNTFEPDAPALLATLHQMAIQVNDAYRTNGGRISIVLAPVIDRSILHMLSALPIIKGNAPIWRELVHIAEQVVAPEIPVTAGMKDTGTEPISDGASDLAERLKDFDLDEEDKARLAFHREDIKAQKMANRLLEGIHQPAILLVADPPVRADMSLTHQHADTAVTKAIAQALERPKFSLAYETLSVLMEVARKIAVLDAHYSTPLSEVRLDALARLKETTSTLSGHHAAEWQNFLRTLACDTKLFPRYAESDTGTDGPMSEFARACETLEESESDVLTKARTYSGRREMDRQEQKTAEQAEMMLHLEAKALAQLGERNAQPLQATPLTRGALEGYQQQLARTHLLAPASTEPKSLEWAPRTNDRDTPADV